MPKFANLTDISLLREDARDAEIEGDFALAFQLWMRVNVASGGTDMKAINAFERLANRNFFSTNLQPKITVSNQGIKTPSAPPVIKIEESTVELASTSDIDYHKSKDWWLGLILVLGASIVLSLQNILVRVIFLKSNIFGLFSFGGLVEPTPSNSFIVLFLRMVLATPIMWIAAKFVFRVDVFRDFEQLLKPNRRLLFWRVALSALLQFISFALLYMALCILSPGIVVTLFFLFPTFTVLMAWFIFGDRPSQERWFVIGIIYFGIMLTYNIFAPMKPDTSWGVIASILSGLAFAGYIISSQRCFKQLNPVSFTSINFSIILLLCIGALYFTLPSFSLNGSLVFMCFLIALTTVGGYLLNSFGTKLMGAIQASVVSACGPMFTTVLASTMLGNTLEKIQLLGVFLVTVGVGMLSIQNMHKKNSK